MPFKSKAQQRYMFSEHPRIAERWAEHTPDMKDLPERAKTAGYWDMMLKWAAVDPTIASHVKRVARRMKYDVPTDAEIEAMFPKGWEKNSPSWQAQFEKSQWLKEQNTAKAHAKDVAAGRAPKGSTPHTKYGPGWSSVPKQNWASRAAKGVMRHSGAYGLGGFSSPLLIPLAIRKQHREARRGLTEKEFEEASRKTVGRGASIGAIAGGLLGLGIPMLAFHPEFRAAGGLRRAFAREPQIAAPLTLKGMELGLYSMPYGLTAGSIVGSKFLPGKAEEIRERKKAAAEEEPAIPERFLTKKFTLPSLGIGAVTGAADPAVQVILKRLEHFQKMEKKPPLGTLFRNMPKGTLKKSLKGGTKGAVGGLLSGYLTGRLADKLIQKKLKENAV